ncbi:MAG: iron-containing alcohol dehydrogenase family protein [Negativicutes bacterium]|nr:iron-containing alcohol dehydrogenase family protein [Negativicutes bacterium]
MELSFHMPTKIYFGADCISKNGAEYSRWGKRALIVTGRNSARASGALADVEQVLTQQGMEWAVFDQIEENPTIEMVEAGGQAARRAAADLIIGIGGGSPLDAAKAIAVLAVNEIPAVSLFDGKFPVRPLPVIAVPLTAGTGSEVTQYSILIDAQRQTKRSFSHPDIFPKAAFLDAKYTASLPWAVTVNTALDALSHVLEGYVSKKANILSDSLALEAIAAFGKTLAALSGHSTTPDVRERLLYVSMLGGMVIAHTGTTMVHSLGYSLTYFRDIPHGRANGLLLAEYLRFIQPEVPARVDAILGALGLKSVDEFKTVLQGLLGEIEKLTGKEIEEFSGIAIQAANIANTSRKPSLEDLKHVLQESLR